MPRQHRNFEEEAVQFVRSKQDPPWIEERFIDEVIGRGVFATKDIEPGQFVAQYCGQLLSQEEGDKREMLFPSSFRYFFNHRGQKYCVDADEEPLSGPRLGRLINHGNKRCERNAKMRVLVDGTIPVLCLFATKRIAAAEQVLYDYGVKVPWLCKNTEARSKQVVNSSPTSLPKDNAAENFMLPASYQIQETVGSQQLKPTEMAKETEQLATHSEPQEEIETVRETEQQLLHSLQEESKKAEQLATHSEPQEETEAVRETEQQLLHSVLQEESEKAEQLATHSEPQEEAEAVTETEQQLLHSVPQEGSEKAEEAEQLAVYSELQIETEIPAGLKQQTEIQQYSEVSESQGETQTPERSGQHQEHIEGMQETESQCDMFGQFHDELKDVEEELCIQVFRPQGMPFGFSMAGGAGSASVSGIQQDIFVLRINEHGLSGKAGLSVGDRILQINGRSLIHATLEQAVDCLLTTSGNVAITVRRLVSRITSCLLTKPATHTVTKEQPFEPILSQNCNVSMTTGSNAPCKENVLEVFQNDMLESCCAEEEARSTSVAGKRHRGDSANEVADSTNSKKQRLDCVCTNAAPESAGAYRMLIDGQIVYKRGRVISSDVEPSESDNSDDETYHPDDEVSSSESSESSLSYGKRRSFHKKGVATECMQQDLHLQFDSNEQMARSSDADSILSARILKELPRKRKQHAVSGKKSVSVDPSASSVGRQTKRRKVKCPVLHCTAEVVHLPRHLRLSHGWKAEDARTALQRSCLRKTYTLKNPHKPRVSSDRHKPRQCPIDGCLSVVKRLPPHLQQHHHIDLKSSLYRELLMTSRRVQKDKKRGLLGDEGYSEESESSEANGFVAEVSDADEEDGPSSQQWSSCRPPAVMDSMQGSSNTALGEIADEERESCVPRQMKVKATRALVDDECAEFASWLASADGGLKDNKCAKQHACQIKTIITAVDSDETGSAVLLEKKTIQDRFLGCYVDQKNLAPGTIKSYLTSLRHWYSFLLQKNAATQTQEMKQHIHTLHDCIGHWLSSYRKECSKRLLTKMDNDMHKLITPKQIKMFEKSLPALDAVKLLGEMCNAERKLFLSQHQYVLLRDFLLLQILLSNANRSGVLREVTVDQIKQAREVDGRIVISVQEHKTAWKYGPAKLVVTAMVMSWLRIFIRHVRPQVLEGKMNEGERHLFLSWTGEQLSSGQISKSLQTIWKRAGLGEDITCTLVRKSAVTAVHEHQPALKANLAGLMCHAQETATKYYRIVEKEKTSVAAAKALNEVMRGESSGTKDATREESGGKGNMRGELRKTHSRLIRDTTKDDTVTEQSTDASDRFVWSHDLVHTLQSVFADELRSHSIRLETVKMKIATSSVLAKVEAKKVYDKVRSLISKGAPDQETVNNDLAGALLQLPSDTLEDRMNRTTAVDSDAASDIVPPTTLATKIHKLYDDNAVTIIASLCKEIIRGGAISRDRIQAALSSCADGASLLQQFSMDQLMSRVKYERRKTRAHDNRQADC